MVTGNRGLIVVAVGVASALSLLWAPLGGPDWRSAIIGVTLLLILMAYGDITPDTITNWVERAAISAVIGLCLTLIAVRLIFEVQVRWWSSLAPDLIVVWIVLTLVACWALLGSELRMGASQRRYD